jgi:hypothetical protein
MPFEVNLKGWLQVSECLLCPETVLLPPGQLIRFEYDDPDVQHYYRIVAKYGTGDVNYVLSRQFSSVDNIIDGSQNISYKTGGILFPDNSNVMGLVVPNSNIQQ